jgi:hypothetical protein
LFIRRAQLGERFWKSYQRRRELVLNSKFRGLSIYGQKTDKITLEAVELRPTSRPALVDLRQSALHFFRRIAAFEPESVCFSMIFGNALGRSFSPSSNSSWCICFTDPCGSRRNPSADKRTLRPAWFDYNGTDAVGQSHSHLPKLCCFLST